VTSTEALGKIKTKYGIYYVYGNHDKGLMNDRDFSASYLASILKKNNIHILEDATATLGKHITLVGVRMRRLCLIVRVLKQ
jgi:predicted MPP superfamily phosphohydrolase